MLFYFVRSKVCVYISFQWNRGRTSFHWNRGITGFKWKLSRIIFQWNWEVQFSVEPGFS